MAVVMGEEGCGHSEELGEVEISLSSRCDGSQEFANPSRVS
jgi:hypothetical protein